MRQVPVEMRKVQLAARTRDKESALDALRNVCCISDSHWPINNAVAECRKSGWSDDVDEALREVMEKADDFHPYTLYAWIDGPEGEAVPLEQKLHFIDRCIEVHPQAPQYYDIKADLLAHHERYEEALKTCFPSAFGDVPPMMLRGRAAWVTARKGDRRSAIDQMRAILADHPEYQWGWKQLAHWLDAEGIHSEFLEATENLVRLDGNDAMAFSLRGEAKLYTGDRRGAKADFQKAFDLDPNNGSAGLHLIDELIKDGELDAAEETLSRLQEHVDGPAVRWQSLRLGVKQRDEETAKEEFSALCVDKDASPMLLQKAVEFMSESGFSATVDEVLNEAVDKEDAVAQVGRLWVERHSARNDASFEKKLPDLLARGAIGREALYAAVEAFGLPSRADRLEACLRQYDEELRSTDRGWAKAAASLVRVKKYDVAAAWVADWKQRDLEESWMLHPIALAFRMLGRDAEAYEVSQRALCSARVDDTTDELAVWVAIEDALAGRTADAEKILSQVNPQDLSDIPQVLHGLAQSLVAVQRASSKEKRAVFIQAKAKAEEVLTSLAPKERNEDLSRTYARWVKRLGKDSGGLGAKMWALWKGFRPTV